MNLFQYLVNIVICFLTIPTVTRSICWEKHEKIVIFYTGANQVDQVEEKIIKLEETQNDVKQELFLMRNLKTDIVKGLQQKNDDFQQIHPKNDKPANDLYLHMKG